MPACCGSSKVMPPCARGRYFAARLATSRVLARTMRSNASSPSRTTCSRARRSVRFRSTGSSRAARARTPASIRLASITSSSAVRSATCRHRCWNALAPIDGESFHSSSAVGPATHGVGSSAGSLVGAAGTRRAPSRNVCSTIEAKVASVSRASAATSEASATCASRVVVITRTCLPARSDNAPAVARGPVLEPGQAVSRRGRRRCRTRRPAGDGPRGTSPCERRRCSSGVSCPAARWCCR